MTFARGNVITKREVWGRLLAHRPPGSGRLGSGGELAT
jgi:hypothetical protein